MSQSWSRLVRNVIALVRKTLCGNHIKASFLSGICSDCGDFLVASIGTNQLQCVNKLCAAEYMITKVPKDV